MHTNGLVLFLNSQQPLVHVTVLNSDLLLVFSTVLTKTIFAI